MERLVVTTKGNEIWFGKKKDHIIDFDKELKEFLKDHSFISEDEINNVGIDTNF